MIFLHPHERGVRIDLGMTVAAFPHNGKLFFVTLSARTKFIQSLSILLTVALIRGIVGLRFLLVFHTFGLTQKVRLAPPRTPNLIFLITILQCAQRDAFPYAHTNSCNTISSARLRMLFMTPTHAIWSYAFSASVTPSRSAICLIIKSTRSLQVWSISARCWSNVPDRNILV